MCYGAPAKALEVAIVLEGEKVPYSLKFISFMVSLSDLLKNGDLGSQRRHTEFLGSGSCSALLPEDSQGASCHCWSSPGPVRGSWPLPPAARLSARSVRLEEFLTPDGYSGIGMMENLPALESEQIRTWT